MNPRVLLRNLALGALGCALLAVAIAGRFGEPPLAPVAQVPLPPPLPPGAAPREERWVGVVLPKQAVDIAPERDGRVEEIKVFLGDKVKAGDLLAKLDSRELLQNLRMAEAQRRIANAEKERARVAFAQAEEQHARSQKIREHIAGEELARSRFAEKSAAADLEAAGARLSEKDALVAQLRAGLEDHELRAPFDGTVSAMFSSAGMFVSRGTPLMHVISNNGLLVRFAVPESSAAELKLGAPVKVDVETPQVQLVGTIHRVSPEVDVASRRIFAEAQLDDAVTEAAGTLLAGAAARVLLSPPAPATTKTPP